MSGAGRFKVSFVAGLFFVTAGAAWAQSAAQKPPQTVKPQVEVPAQAQSAPVARRDPFDPLVSKQRPGNKVSERLPPGKAGLVISTLRVDGLVKAPSGMIAVVSNPRQQVYFLREGDKLYDGFVERILTDSVIFRETSKDPFGKPVERQVTKRLHPSAGES